MKKLIGVAVLSMVEVSLGAASVDQVIVRQQWPWSTDVKVEYRLSDVTTAQDLTVRAFDGTAEFDAAKLRKAIKGPLYGVTSLVGSFTIDPVQAFGTAKPTIDNLRVKIELADSSPLTTEVVYKVINLDQNPITVTDLRRADFYNGSIDPQYAAYSQNFLDFKFFSVYMSQSPLENVFIWSGITNGPLYRTSKIALRKIPAAGQSFEMGEYGTEKRTVSFTKDFWMGVFPITQAQMRYMIPSYVAWETNELYAATRVATSVSWDTARGLGAENWPLGSHADVNASSFIGKLQAATGNKRFDLPTSAQWEFGARAGATGKYPSYTSGTDWYCYAGCFENREGVTPSADERNCDLSKGALPPGRCAPNGYGLYDVMGIVWQHCLDRAGTPLPDGTDPRGPENSTGDRVCRGGGYGYTVYDLGAQWARTTWWDTSYVGFRLCLHEED